MDDRAREVIRQGNKLFSDKRPIDSLWQEIALNFYPERADFTSVRNDGEEYSDHLFSSYPVLARRELGNMLSSNLRPQAQKWFGIHVEDDDVDDNDEARKYLEFLTDVQWRAMYESQAMFVKATKQGDHDYAAFGNAVIRVGPRPDMSGMLYQNYHLRDCAWSENVAGVVDVMHRDWKPTARQLKEMFPDKISPEVKLMCKKDPEKTVNCRHAVLPSRLYHYESPMKRKYPFTSLFVECESETVLEETGIDIFDYVVPRWMTVSGSPYGRSMATSVALPDGRTIQVVVRTIREAGEKFVDPPMIGIGDAIRGDIALYPGGITIADMEYDERLGEVLRPLTQDKGGMPVGFEIAAALREDIRNAFMLDKIQLPQAGNDMTAFEVRRRIEEHIRGASPIFEPIEKEYNQPLCEKTFEFLSKYGAFPPPEMMPEVLQKGQEVKFSFRSPLSDMADQNETEIYKEVLSTVFIPAAQVDPAQLANVNLTEATRDAARAAGWKADWFNPPEAVDQERQRIQQQQAAQAAQQQAMAEGAVAEQQGKGRKAMIEAGGGGA